MPKILVNVSEGQKELWVAAAHDERVSLSEWIRRRCDDGLGSGGVARAADSASPVVAAAAPPVPSSRKCPADTPKGTRCKLCGEKH